MIHFKVKFYQLIAVIPSLFDQNKFYQKCLEGSGKLIKSQILLVLGRSLPHVLGSLQGSQLGYAATLSANGVTTFRGQTKAL